MAVQRPMYCGNCGAPLPPGATYCGRCGAPVGVPVQVAAYPAYQGYAYPRAQPAPGRIGRDHTMQIAVAAGLIFMLILGAVFVSAIALFNNPGSHPVCTVNCGPKIATALPAQATYTSSTYGFEVDYDANWTVENKTGDTIELGTDAGGLVVTGQKSSQPLDQVINAFVSGLPTATYQDITPVMDVKGAHLGDENGTGTIYSANYITSNAKAIKVRFAVIAAAKNGVTVVMFALNQADTKDFPSGIPEGQKFDYMAQTFRWGS